MNSSQHINRVPKGVPTGGEFAESARGESDLAFDPGGLDRPSSGIVEALPYEVPDLSERQQDKTGLPANFAQAFDTHFADAVQALDDAGGDTERAKQTLIESRDAGLKDLEAAFPQATGPIAASDEAVDGDGWYLSSPADSDATVISYIVRAHDADEGNYDIDGPDLTTKGGKRPRRGCIHPRSRDYRFSRGTTGGHSGRRRFTVVVPAAHAPPDLTREQCAEPQ